MIWALRRCRLAVSTAGAYQRMHPKMTAAKIRLFRLKAAVTGFLELL